MRQNTAEIDKFNALAATWWDPKGPMAPLHWMNPARLDFIRQHLKTSDKTGLDVGCGAGLLTEPLARMGYRMTGVDGAVDALTVARQRADAEGLNIKYVAGELPHVDLGGPYDFVTALEIIEHVDDPATFIDAVAPQVKKGGRVFLSTLNRTLKSRVLGVYAAEYVLRVLPVGTHNPKKFIKPSELVAMLEDHGFKLAALSGLVFKPLQKTFALDAHDLEMNYILAAEKR
ncbi:MAG: bifunctional 2-polyprenyl-6-hydroxyphenol methylase/3-demethylubiquinol 3-O-methyltransferase UbiG [Bdellovibrionales bacterium]